MDRSKLEELRSGMRFAGPNAGILAIVYTVLSFAGALTLAMSSKAGEHFPRPWENGDIIIAYFRLHASALRTCAFLELGAALVLGVFTATIVSQMRYLRVRAAGPMIALFGGTVAAMSVAACSCLLWASSYPGVTLDPGMPVMVYSLGYALGGAAFALSFAILTAGISIAGGLTDLLPDWIVALGGVVVVAGILSWFSMFNYKMAYLIPVTRIFGVIWMIAAGFMLPNRLADFAAVGRPEPVEPRPINRAA